jgi:hypothetical protein
MYKTLSANNLKSIKIKEKLSNTDLLTIMKMSMAYLIPMYLVDKMNLVMNNNGKK